MEKVNYVFVPTRFSVHVTIACRAERRRLRGWLVYDGICAICLDRSFRNIAQKMRYNPMEISQHHIVVMSCSEKELFSITIRKKTIPRHCHVSSLVNNSEIHFGLSYHESCHVNSTPNKEIIPTLASR